MAQKDPTTASNKWNTGMAGAAQSYKDGVNAVKVAPNQLAAAAVDTWAANTIAAKSLYQAKNAAVGLTAWQSAATSKGADRLVTGAQAALPKFQAFMTNYLPKVYGMVGQLPPRGSYAQNKARAAAMMDALHNAKGSF